MTQLFCINCKLSLKLLFSAKDKTTNKTYKYYQCTNCKLIQINPFPDIKNLYNRNPRTRFINENPQAQFANKIPLGNFFINKYLELTKNRRKEVSSLRKSGKILDVGCSGGGFLKNFRGKWRLYGLEVNSEMAKLARKNVPNAKIYSSRIENANLPRNYFDIITFWHVFEHLKNPTLVLEKIYSALKVGGFLIIEVPNADSLYRKIFSQNWQLLIVPEHLYFYSKKSLSQILSKNGFEVTKVKHFAVFTPSAISSLANFLRSYGLNSNIAILTGLTLFPLILVINLLSFTARENLMVVAKKQL